MVRGVGAMGGLDRHQRADLVGPDRADSQAGQQGGASEIGVHGVGDLLDGPTQDVGVDRAPQRRRGPAADGPDGAERPSDEALDALGRLLAQLPRRVSRSSRGDGAVLAGLVGTAEG